MELRQYAGVVLRWWWLIALATLVAAGSTYLATRSAPPVYQAKTTLMVGQVTRDPNPTNYDFWAGQQLASTYAELVRREPVLRATVEALGLDWSWESLAGAVSVKVVEGTQLFEIYVIDTDPARAQAIANEIAHQLILQSPTTPSEEELERRAFLSSQLSDLQAKIESTEAQIAELEQELAEATSARQMQDLQGQITSLQGQVHSWQANYAQLLGLLNQGDINYLSVVEPAALPAYPISPSLMRNVMLAGAVGLVLAVGAAFLLEYLDDTIKSPDDVRAVANLPTLGAIARIRGDSYQEQLIAAHSPLSPIAEAYRLLRTNIHFSSVDQPLRTLMVASPGPTEGKSVTLANLAVVLAQAGLRVIAVDTDLRRPVLHKVFGLSNSHGLSDAILQPNPGVLEHVQETGIENLRLLASGSLPPNPTELLGSSRMKAVIDELSAHADIVLFDSPPLLVVADAAVLGARVDGVLLVNDAGSTRRAAAKRAVEELQRARANLLGVVLNRLSLRREGGYYNYQYYYYYRSEDGERRKRRRRKGLLKRLFGRK